MTCLLHTLFGLGMHDEKNAKAVLTLPRRTVDELVLSSALSALCFTDLSVRESVIYMDKVFATDASLNRGAITSTSVCEELSRLLWLGGDRKGGYTRLDSEATAILRGLGEHEDDGAEGPDSLNKHVVGPCKAVEFVFDFVEVCSGSGRASAKAAAMGLTVCPPIDISKSPHFDLTNLDLLWWILGMLKTGRFRSVCCEPPCTTFSPAQHPASRSYRQPIGLDRRDPKTLLGNTSAFRCFVICWTAYRYSRPSLLETPKLSKMAWLTIWQYLISLGFEEAFLASCLFGSPHKKEFRLLFHGLERALLDVRCRGGHGHLRIEGKYTKASGEYVDGVAERFALAFFQALQNKENSETGIRSKVFATFLCSSACWESSSLSWICPYKAEHFRCPNSLQRPASPCKSLPLQSSVS